MKRLLLVAALALAPLGVASSADARPRCPDIVCDPDCIWVADMIICF